MSNKVDLKQQLEAAKSKKKNAIEIISDINIDDFDRIKQLQLQESSLQNETVFLLETIKDLALANYHIDLLESAMNN